MLGNYRVAAQLVASRMVLSSTEVVGILNLNIGTEFPIQKLIFNIFYAKKHMTYTIWKKKIELCDVSKQTASVI
jgi:hypothetical protein